MKPLLLVSALFLSILIISQAAVANFQIGPVTGRGVGCPKGPIAATISPDGSAISILFDDFSFAVAQGYYSGNALTRTCHFHIPLELPPGTNIEMDQIDYRGFADLQGPSAVISTSQTSSYGSMLGASKSVLSNITNDFFISQKFRPITQTKCLGQKFISFVTSIEFKGFSMNSKYIVRNSQVVIDTADLSREPIRVGVRLKLCR